MHETGHRPLLNVDELMDVCKRHDAMLIEDAAEALSSFYHGRWGATTYDGG